MAYINLLGQTFGKLKVLRKDQNPPNSKRGAYWICQCECGNIKSICSNDLRSSRGVKSCGCSKMEPHTTHNMCHTSEYETWKQMKRRCYNKNFKEYKHYGGRGITICKRWLESFENFFEDMGPKPFQKSSIERINNNGNYEPGNCKWSYPEEQNRNRQYNVIKNKDQANQIRKLYSTGNYTQKQLAQMNNCSEPIIWQIINNYIWT